MSYPRPQPDDALTTSRVERDCHVTRVDALDKVRALIYLPGDTYITTEMAAAYFEVDIEAVRKLTQRSTDELETDGYRVIEGHELRDMKSLSGVGGRARSLALFPKRAVLRIAMLLRDSVIARAVRDEILNRAEQAQSFDLATADGQIAHLQQMMAIAQRNKALELENQAKREQIAELEPKAAQADHHRAADDLVPVGDFANNLKAWAKRQHNVRVKHEQVWVFLGDIGLLIRGNTLRHNQPTAFAVERDFVRVKTTEFETNTRGLQASTSPRLTAAGEGHAWDRAVKRIAAHGSLTAPTKAIEGASS